MSSDIVSCEIVINAGVVALSPEEIIARKLTGTYGPGALGQAMTCASLARVMADKSSTGIWNKVIAILTERAATPRAGQN
jgi:hypothetical protein